MSGMHTTYLTILEVLRLFNLHLCPGWSQIWGHIKETTIQTVLKSKLKYGWLGTDPLLQTPLPVSTASTVVLPILQITIAVDSLP